jgi:hypothetical protein
MKDKLALGCQKSIDFRHPSALYAIGGLRPSLAWLAPSEGDFKKTYDTKGTALQGMHGFYCFLPGLE